MFRGVGAVHFGRIVAGQLFLAEHGAGSALQVELLLINAHVVSAAGGFLIGIQAWDVRFAGASERGLLHGRGFDSGFNAYREIKVNGGFG